MSLKIERIEVFGMKANLLMSLVTALTLVGSCASLASAAGGDDLNAVMNAVRANPGDLNVRRQMVQLMIRKGMTVRAAAEMKVILQAAGGSNADDLTTLGDAARYSGDYAGAIESYKKVLQVSPMSSKALSGLALSYASAGQVPTAVQICRTGLAQAGSNAAGKQELIATLNSVQRIGQVASSAQTAAY